jgi:outer membrane protein TolC
LQAEADVALAKNNLKKTDNNFMPVVDFSAKRSVSRDVYTDRKESSKDTTLKLQAKINLYNGGKDYNTKKKNISLHKQKQIAYEDEKRKTIYNVKISLNEYRNLQERSILENQMLISADQAYVAAEFDYNYAKIDEDGLLAAMESLYTAEKQHIDFKYDIINSRYKLLLNMGILQQHLKETLKNEME